MREKKRIVSMELIRIFSCWCVITCHFNACISGFSNGLFLYPNLVVPSFYLENRVYLGDIGTSLFFILSGASLMLSYRPGKLKNYYAKRWLAMYPMFYVAYIVATIADFFIMKGFGGGDLRLLFFSLIGFDGYLASLGWLGFDFYKLGEWFFGCIVMLYLIFPLLYKGMEKKPAITFSMACLVYLMYGGWSHSQQVPYVSNYFFLRIPELLIGMLFVKYNLREKPKVMLGGACVIAAAAWMLRNYIRPLTLCISICILLFAIMTWIGDYIEQKNVAKILLALSGLTFPVYLSHHWMISRLVMGFDLSCMSRRSSWMFYGIFLLFSFVLAYLLKQLTNYIMETLKKLRE